MAGGGGTRFWPLSRKERPKQLLNLSGKDLMINETLDRLNKSVESENLFIVTNISQAKIMREETNGRLPLDHILEESAARNTSACIGYAAMEIVTKYGDGVMCILPSDAFIKDEEEFTRVLDAAMKACEETDALVTIGIQPTFPATGYGYIKAVANSETDIADTKEVKVSGRDVKYYSKVEEFVEKPDLDTAKEYLAAGNYLWNSGMFIWKASTILGYMERLLPDVYAKLLEIKDALGKDHEKELVEKIYPTIPKISIDYGVMERADNVLVLPGNFGWNDIGSLDMLYLMKDADENGNTVNGEVVTVDTSDCILYGKDMLIATAGLKDMIVVATKDAVMVCPKDRAQQVKDIVDKMTEGGLDTYL